MSLSRADTEDKIKLETQLADIKKELETKKKANLSYEKEFLTEFNHDEKNSSCLQDWIADFTRDADIDFLKMRLNMLNGVNEDENQKEIKKFTDEIAQTIIAFLADPIDDNKMKILVKYNSDKMELQNLKNKIANLTKELSYYKN